MIKITYDPTPIIKLYQSIIKFLICERAYKGYVWLCESDNSLPISYLDFSKFNYLKIEGCFRIYRARYLNVDYNKAELTFQNVVFNR